MARKANVFYQPEPNGEDGSENIQPNGIEQLFGPTRPEDEREFMNDDGDGKSDENKKASVPAPSKERTTMSTSKYDLVKKITNIFNTVVAAAKVTYYSPKAKAELPKELKNAKDVKIDSYPEDFKRMAQEWADLMEKTVGFEADNELIVKAQEALNKVVASEKSKYQIEEHRKRLNELTPAIREQAKFLKTGFTSLGRDYAQIVQGKVSEASLATEVLAELRRKVPAMAKTIDEVTKELKEAAEKLARDVDIIAEESIKHRQEIEQERAKKEKSKTPKKPAKTDVNNPWIRSAAADVLAESIEHLEAAEEHMAGLAEELGELESQVAELDAESVSLEEFVAEHGEEIPAEDGGDEMDAPEEAPAEEPQEAPEHEEAPAAPEHEPSMELVPASNDGGDLDKTAKAFPSEHDQSGNLLEIVEADGAKQLVVKKDVRTKVTQRVNDYFSGTFTAAEAVCVDFGDYISNGKITAYAGKGIYKVKMEDGRDLEIPVASIFSANSANKLWE